MMSFNILIQSLNNKQSEVVTAPLENALILAGAGSGKTRVLAYRIAWLISVKKISPFSIMSVTFTNKAAIEMRSRIEGLLMDDYSDIWNGTFHGICHRILRVYFAEANLSKDFQIIDAEDQIRLLRRLIKNKKLDEKKWPVKQIMTWINKKKDKGLRPQHIDPYLNPVTKINLQIYSAYQELCDRSNLVDFAEILLRSHELLRDNEKIRAYYHSLLKYVLVDEFQDTNNIQYAWLRMIVGIDCNIMVVGDDDQSIYGWRGAKVKNIKRFTFDFPSVRTIRLEQNYRSTKNILEASNVLISNNTQRMGKELWTNEEKGDFISIYSAYNELDEADFVVKKIQEWKEQGGLLNSVAILYRNNIQSRSLEEALVQANVPYHMYGGIRFFERQEIKDALGYLRLINNSNDDSAFERIVNTPTRGLGNKTLENIRLIARERHIPMWEASIALLDEKILASRVEKSLGQFIELITILKTNTLGMSLHKQTDYVIRCSGLLSMYQNEKDKKIKSRIENLEELISATYQFEKNEKSKEMKLLTAFLTYSSLRSDENQTGEFEDAVQLMTLHSAKGLEFPLVFIVGLEEGLFPSQISIENSLSLEEERRLCYVGMTRAMEKLYIIHAGVRRLYGQNKYRKASRFISELPEACLKKYV
ncbi:DNA helicase II [Candidatus Photodesmus katoptron Akat1]|uniref:DNA 3'-5' helicase n=1 Tax=Candidatus Photodesmus katoptron Akat1 TaxID=1236703 RepID=S3EH10_9GAMM|nr:DNA helicase II [Candidatus Photodesmus katoptron Akat1]